MSKNCIITTIPAVIDNPSLEVLGQIEIENTSESAISYGVRTVSGKTITAELPNGTTITIDAVDSSAWRYNFPPGVTKFKPFYNIGGIDASFTSGVLKAKIKTSSLKYATGINRLVLNQGSYTMEFLEGDIAELSALVNMARLGLRRQSTKLYGELKTLAPCKLLSSINLYLNTGITGTLEDFLKDQFELGRESGTITVELGSSSVTFNGSGNDNKYVTFTSSGVNVYSDSAMTTLIGSYTTNDGWVYP